MSLPRRGRRRAARRLGLAAGGLVMSAAACGGPHAAPDAPLRIEMQELRRDVRGLRLSPGVELAQAIALRSDMERFGGFSAAEISREGTEMLLISDKGRALRLGLERDGAGRIAGLIPRAWVRLQGPEGLDPRGMDAEGLSLPVGGDVDGPFRVTFEGWHRNAPYAGIGAREGAPLPLDMVATSANSGFEATAERPDGRLVLLHERLLHDEAESRQQGFAERRDGGFTRFTLAARGDLTAVGADIDETGALWVVERGFSLLGGFHFGLSVFAPDPDPAAPGADPEGGGGFAPGRRLAWITGPLADNAEALTVWRDDAGRMRLVAVSDDNFMPFQRSILYEFIVDPDALPPLPSGGR